MKRYYTNAYDSRVFEHPDGPFVLYAEHETEVRDCVLSATARIAALEAQDEVHWKTRRTLLSRLTHLESALTRLTDGMKYSTEVVRIARGALGTDHG